MHFDLRPFLISWIVLVSAVLALIVWRKVVASHEDDNIHVLQPGGILTEQVAVAKKLDVIDKWGKILTVIVVALGLIIGTAWIYQVWVQGAQIPTGS